MSDVIKDLYEVIRSRREGADENSYTAYLFREGLDKILKKVGEESAETIIAAKSLEAALANSFTDEGVSNDAAPANSFADGDVFDKAAPVNSFADDGVMDEMHAMFATAMANSFAERARADLTNEVADLVYHLLVMLVERGVTWDEIEEILAKRAAKTGNLKPPRDSQ